MVCGTTGRSFQLCEHLNFRTKSFLKMRLAKITSSHRHMLFFTSRSLRHIKQPFPTTLFERAVEDDRKSVARAARSVCAAYFLSAGRRLLSTRRDRSTRGLLTELVSAEVFLPRDARAERC